MKKFFRFILLIINVAFIVALLLSTLSGSIPPSRFVGISVLSYGYFVLLLCNVVFIIIWLCMSRWEFLFSLAAILIRCSFLPLFFQVGGTTSVEPEDTQLKVLSFNVHSFGGLDSDSLMTSNTGASQFLELIEEEQPDVICLQEFYQPSKVRVSDSLQARGYKYHYGVHGTSIYSQIILFSRCPIVNVQAMDEASKFYADIRKAGREVRFCCVHLDSYELTPEDHEGLEKLSHAQPDSTTHRLMRKLAVTTRNHEKEWKEDLLPMIEKSRIPVVVAGDFNDTPASYIYQQITDYLSDPYVEQGRGFSTTYHGPYPAYRIDYIFHSPELPALSYHRLKTNISDHYPIVVQLDLAQ